MADPTNITISSLRGGLNNTDAAVSLAPDQCTVAENVEFDTNPLGSRRLGCTPIDHPDLGDYIPFLFRHLPTIDQEDAQLWALGVTGSTPDLRYKDTAWNVPTIVDAIVVSSNRGYDLCAVTLHGKMFICYKSAVNRMHVWDGTTLRRTGVAESAAPTVANTGAGAYIGTRYFRVRFTRQVGGVTTGRSEPSATTTFVPSGAGSAARVTKPASVSEGETHWELEASIDGSTFYRIATTVVGTTTVDDSTGYVTGYGAFTLSEDSGDYENLHSAEFCVADDDRLILGSSFEDDALSSRVTWTPVLNDPGVGNDERSPLDTDNFKDLDTYEGGRMTGLSRTVNGYIFVFKFSHIYQLTRSGLRARAYDAHCLSKTIGAIKGSVIEGADQSGRPCLYFTDPNLGPCRIGDGGVQVCSLDIQNTWQTVNLDAVVTTRSLFYPNPGRTPQANWWMATDDADTPDLRIMLQTNYSRQEDDGIRRGWTTNTGFSSEAVSCCLFSENIDANTDRSHVLRPFIGMLDGTIQRCDTGTTDAGTAYSARIVTAPIINKGVLNRFGVMAAALVAKAAANVTIVVSAIRDFGAETIPFDVDLDPTSAEDPVIKPMDSFKCSSSKVVQISFADEPSPSGTWALDQFAMKIRTEETA